MTATAIRFLERLATIAWAPLLFLGLASCGSGGVSDPGTVNDPTRITVLPGSGTTLYAGQPTTFVVSGGTGSYIVSSGNQAVIPLSGSFRGNTFTVIPNPVAADTEVSLTVRDTGTTPLQTVTVTVKPGTVNNDIQVTPSSTQGSICPAGTLCSGGDAVVTVTLSQAGLALAGRVVQFDAVSGDFSFITSPSGLPEALAKSVQVLTDSSGRASVRIRATADAPNQTAILQATDLSSGAFRRVALTIAQATGASPGFFVSPSNYTFQGTRQDQCASLANSGIVATFYIFGGTPPYTIASTPNGLVLSRESVSFSGGSFNVYPTGQCLENAPIVIRDSSGRTTTVTVSNVRGTDAVPPLVVSPNTVSLSSCSSIATVTAAGGTGHYIASAGSNALIVTPFGQSTFQISRNPNTSAPPSPVLVGISDSISTVTVTVNLSGGATGFCSSLPFDAQPRSVTLNSCTGTAQVTLTGGAGNYGFDTNNSAIKVTLSGNVLTIGRNPGPAAAANNAIVHATDTASPPIKIDVFDTTTAPCS